MLKKRILCLLLALALFLPLIAGAEKVISLSAADYPVEEDEWYLSMEEVAVYLASFKHLPENFLTKKEAQSLGWSSSKGNLDDVAPLCAIGGDRFGNYEGVLPEKKGRTWTECDVNYEGGYRNGERICFSSDELIYYSNDHYSTFTKVEVSFDGKTETEKADNPKTDDAESVAAYIHEYGELPDFYLTKDEAQKLGWSSKKDNLGTVAPGYSIGGSMFQNREGLLPRKSGRIYYECDVNTVNGKRGSDRLVYSNDGLIYFTDDGYKTFEQLY